MSRGVLMLLALVAFSMAQTLVVNGTQPFKAYVKEGALVINGSEITLPQERLSWNYNGTYTVYGIYYSNPNCQLGTWPNQPRFYITCNTGSDFIIVAVKDPKARVICKTNRGPLQPSAASKYVEIYQTNGLNIECESGYSAVASAPGVLLGVLAGITAATATLLLALGILLLRALLKK
ncbi:hypothetical protein [Pyrobaculum aerophilum]|nr:MULTISPECIES: hypothetical protein [Pyrobaculum]MCX8137041.1 hypothetical protein [Pyrobaculum aerophilum]HII47097.1 hypothetical protein [Pyrobaculum aerophilum]